MTKSREDILYRALFRIVREDTALGESQGMKIEMGPFAVIADAALREYQAALASPSPDTPGIEGRGQ